MQIYMAYMGLGSALFTALNKDSCELYHEHVPFDPATAQRMPLTAPVDGTSASNQSAPDQ